MLFAVIYNARAQDGDEAIDQRAHRLFANWAPPTGLEMKTHLSFADGGGLAIVDAANAAALYEAIVPWLIFHEYRIHPAVDISEAVPIWERTLSWRESVR